MQKVIYEIQEVRSPLVLRKLVSFPPCSYSYNKSDLFQSAVVLTFDRRNKEVRGA